MVMVGLPYANPNDVELKERMRVAAASVARANIGSQSHGASGATTAGGQEYYERLCMRAVNQCIGRAIRHRHDHAAILLLDRRYARPRILDALPSWITGRRADESCSDETHGADRGAEPGNAGGVSLAANFGAAQASLCRFFREHKTQAAAAAAADSDSGED